MTILFSDRNVGVETDDHHTSCVSIGSPKGATVEKQQNKNEPNVSTGYIMNANIAYSTHLTGCCQATAQDTTVLSNECYGVASADAEMDSSQAQYDYVKEGTLRTADAELDSYGYVDC